MKTSLPRFTNIPENTLQLRKAWPDVPGEVPLSNSAGDDELLTGDDELTDPHQSHDVVPPEVGHQLMLCVLDKAELVNSGLLCQTQIYTAPRLHHMQHTRHRRECEIKQGGNKKNNTKTLHVG